MNKSLGKLLQMLLIIIIWGLISFYLFDIGENTEEIKTIEFEPVNSEMECNAVSEQEIMNTLVKETKNVKCSEDAGFTAEENEMLMRIAMAEAEGEGIKGKAMVIAVVLNRVKDSRFPDTIEGVIFQKGQFSPIIDGRYYKVEPDVDCHLALAEIEKGNYNNIDALYFENAKSSWQSENCEYLYTVGNHRFYKN